MSCDPFSILEVKLDVPGVYCVTPIGFSRAADCCPSTVQRHGHCWEWCSFPHATKVTTAQIDQWQSCLAGDNNDMPDTFACGLGSKAFSSILNSGATSTGSAPQPTQSENAISSIFSSGTTLTGSAPQSTQSENGASSILFERNAQGGYMVLKLYTIWLALYITLF